MFHTFLYYDFKLFYYERNGYSIPYNIEYPQFLNEIIKE